MIDHVAAAMQRLLRLGDSCARGQFAQVFGARLHYLEEGSGPVVVLLHGGTGGGANWFRQLRPLASRFRVLAPDLPGFGLSDPRNLTGPLGTAAAAIFDEWLRSLEVARATVVGTSFGGLAALRLAQRSPDLVEGMLLLDSAGLDRSLHPAVRLGALPLLAPVWARATRRGTARTFRTLLTRGGGTIPAAMQQALIEYLYQTAHRAGADYQTATLRRFASLRGQREYLSDAELAQLRMPVAVVMGRHDPFFSTDAARAAAQRMPDATFHIIEDAGHSPNWETPTAVIRAIEELIAR